MTIAKQKRADRLAAKAAKAAGKKELANNNVNLALADAQDRLGVYEGNIALYQVIPETVHTRTLIVRVGKTGTVLLGDEANHLMGVSSEVFADLNEDGYEAGEEISCETCFQEPRALSAVELAEASEAYSQSTMRTFTKLSAANKTRLLITRILE